MTTRISDETAAALASAWPALLADIANGAGIAVAIRAAGFSPNMVRAFRGENPARDTEWQRAKEESADALADEALEVARADVRHELNAAGEPVVIRCDPAFARVRVDTLLKVAAKRNPRVYSDKAQLDVNVKTVDLTRIISEANARLAGRAPRVLEHDAPRALAHAADAAILHSASKLLELL